MQIFSRIGKFYWDGIRGMTLGRTLWALVLVKLIILFVFLRVFFFTPTLSGKTEVEKSEIVGNRLTPVLTTGTK